MAKRAWLRNEITDDDLAAARAAEAAAWGAARAAQNIKLTEMLEALHDG